MSRILSLLASFALILSIGMGSLAHASEGPDCVETPTSELSAHAEGDSDHVPPDDDRPYPHHHNGCHNHQIGVPALSASKPPLLSQAQTFTPHQAVHIASAIGDPALRPPRA
jgi:hypothetical protein